MILPIIDIVIMVLVPSMIQPHAALTWKETSW